MPHRHQRALTLGLTSAITAAVTLGTGLSPAAASDAGWYDAHTPLAQRSMRANPYLLSLDPTGKRVLAAQWVDRHCRNLLKVAEYHHGRWHGVRTVLRETPSFCHHTPRIADISQSARGRLVVVTSTHGDGDESTYLAAVRQRGHWTPAKVLDVGIGDLKPPVAVARNGAAAVTAIHPMAEGGHLYAYQWRDGRWMRGHRLQEWAEWDHLVAVSPHGGTRWVVYRDPQANAVRLATAGGDTGWTETRATPDTTDSWWPMTATVNSGGRGSILAWNYAGSFGVSGRLAVITCTTQCRNPRFIPGSSGPFLSSAWISGDGGAARWASYHRVGGKIHAATLWSWRKGSEAQAERTLTGFLATDTSSFGSAVAPDGSSVVAAWREADAVVVTTRQGRGRWYDARLQQCRRFVSGGSFGYQLLTVGSAAVVTTQCGGDKRTYFHGLR